MADARRAVGARYGHKRTMPSHFNQQALTAIQTILRAPAFGDIAPVAVMIIASDIA